VGLTGLIYTVTPPRSGPTSTTPRTRGTSTMTFQLRWDQFFLFVPTEIRSSCSHLRQPMVLLQMLPEIHCCVTRSMDKKSWTYARHSRSQGSRTRAPVRSAMSVQTRRLTRSPIPTVKSPNEAVQLCARTKKLARAVRFQCNFMTRDDYDEHLTTCFNDCLLVAGLCIFCTAAVFPIHYYYNRMIFSTCCDYLQPVQCLSGLQHTLDVCFGYMIAYVF
jgi:hypothetical protein